ncbi:MAG: Gmad2 immunoglobulin-like domain-containing protein, partial [Intrasporangium sp.]|uniref:Gmad2 immunoglobulin-like domain-containing protein n=1 Tax=Intrasporangium sp. TaxID=1925024 RepID=UPI003F80C044
MNTDDRNDGHRPEDETVVIGAGLQHVEETVRAQLHREAAAIRPQDRLDAILAEAHGAQLSDADADAGASGRHRWLLPVAAAAVAAAVASGIWVANRPAQTPPPAASPVSPTQQSSTSSPTASTTPESTSSSPADTGNSAALCAKPTSGVSLCNDTQARWVLPLPVYYVGPRTDGSTSLVLFREFGLIDVATRDDAADKATAALAEAVAGGPAGAAYRPMWKGVEVDKVTVTAAEIDVTLSTGAKGLSASEGQIAVDQLVWTAQAAVGKGNLPVRFTLADGGATLAGDARTDHAYTRPTDEMAVWAILSPVWIDAPSRGESLPAGKVTVTGIASTNEANVQWAITKGGTTVASGHTTADVSAPSRGEYSFTTTALPAGDYVVKVF